MPTIPVDPNEIQTQNKPIPRLGPTPSEANLLMALADMNKNGRFAQLPQSTNIEDRRGEEMKKARFGKKLGVEAADEQAIDANVRSDYYQGQTPASKVVDMLRRKR